MAMPVLAATLENNAASLTIAPIWISSGKQGVISASRIRSIFTPMLRCSSAATSLNERNNNLLKWMGSMVQRGLSDKDILAIAPQITLEGYTVSETKTEMRRMIAGARQKGFQTKTKHRKGNRFR